MSNGPMDFEDLELAAAEFGATVLTAELVKEVMELRSFKRDMAFYLAHGGAVPDSEASNNEAQLALKTWMGAKEADQERRWMEIFEKEPAAPKVLIPNLLPRDVFGLVGPGGVTKSTFMLWVMIHISLGRPVFGEEVEQGACLYVSQEDSTDVLHWRVRQLCDALGLSKTEQMTVVVNLNLEDWTTEQRRFVQCNREGNLYVTDWVDRLVSKYGGAGVLLAAMDPAVYFGPGERFVNDAESALMKAARRLSRGLGDASTGFIHHTGQAVAREKTTDQYAGRGGSAFADNARGMLVMHVADENCVAPPPGITDADIEDGYAMQINVAKFSAGRREREPFWILRERLNPWSFIGFAPQSKTAMIKERARRMEAELEENVERVAEWLQGQLRKEPRAYYSLNSAERCYRQIGLGRNEVREAVTVAMATGRLALEEVPKDSRHGRFKTYLQPMKRVAD